VVGRRYGSLVDRVRVLTSRWGTPPSELALAAVVTIAMSVDLQQAAYPVLALLLVLPAGLTLAWRLRQPELPLAAICSVDLLITATATGEYGPQTIFIGVMVALYSAAAHLSGRRALLAGALSLVVVWLSFVSSADGNVDDFFPFLVWGAPWLVGRLARRQAIAAGAAGARAAVLLAEQQAQTREAAGRERDRIARELHDVVAHAVSLMVVQAGAARLAHPDSTSRAALESVETAGRQALVELRAMLGVLRDSAEARDPQPDLHALPALVEQVSAAGLPVELRMTGTATVPAGLALSAYRVVQEALTNALKHAGPVATEVEVTSSDHAVEVVVRNALPAVPMTRTPGSDRGTVGMRERVALHGGSLEAGPDGSDWVVRATLPLRQLVP